MAKQSHRRTGDIEMALTRAFLKGMQLTEEQVGAIIEAHSETVEALKTKNSQLQTELAEAKESVKQGTENSEYKTKYEKEHSEFEKYKAEQEKSKVVSEKKNLYRALLREAGIKEKAIEQILALTNVDDLQVVDGKLQDSDKISADIKSNWSEFVTTTSTKGATVETPPTNNGGKTMTRDEIMAITDRAERREAIKNNPQAFGK